MGINIIRCIMKGKNNHKNILNNNKLNRFVNNEFGGIEKYDPPIP